MKQTIPAGWEEKRLTNVINKVTYTSKIQSKQYKEKGAYPIISQEDIFISGYWDNPDDVYRVKHPIIIFGDHTKVVKYVDFDFVLGADGVKILDPLPLINAKFLYYWTKFIPLRNLGYARHYKLLADKMVCYPSLPEQERIVAKLDKAFAAIDKVKANAEQNLTNAKELFESYLNNIFSNINASFNKKLSDVTKIVGGGTPSKSTPTYYQGNIPWATVRDMNEDDLSKTEFSITNEAVRSSATNIIPANNVIIATRVGLGKVCILMQDTAINQDLKGIIPTKPMNFKYLFWWFKSIKNKIEEAGVGATVKGVKLPFVQNLQIPYISINDQQKIVEKLDAMQEQTKQLEQIYTQKIKECDELKQSILQKAFKGEL